MANYCSWTAWCCLCICRSRACQPLIIPSSNAFTRILCLLMWPIIHSSMVFTRVLYFLMWPKYLVVAEIFRCAIKASSKNCRSCSLNIFILTLFFMYEYIGVQQFACKYISPLQYRFIRSKSSNCVICQNARWQVVCTHHSTECVLVNIDSDSILSIATECFFIDTVIHDQSSPVPGLLFSNLSDL